MVLAPDLGRERVGDKLYTLLVDRLQGLQSCFSPNVLRSGGGSADDGDRAEKCIELFAPISQHLLLPGRFCCGPRRQSIGGLLLMSRSLNASGQQAGHMERFAAGSVLDLVPAGGAV